ncbi:MAG: SusC/RagA family TonB-linked outer membrane protein [Weeksellaceae bacterium]
MRANKLLFSVFTLLLLSSFALAQVTGVVVDDFGPVPDAQVSVIDKGETVTTGEDGSFSITAEIGDQLEITNPMTLATKVFGVSNTNMGELKLSDATIALDDVITLGYTTTTDEAYTGTADVVNSEAIDKKSVSNISQALAGESAGVRVVNSSGQPGSTATVKIRGIGSVNGNTAPLYVVDGVPFEGSLSSINPSDIENTIILKDATATAIYGSRGANGVIVINTKKGKKGSSNISFESKTGFNFNLLPRYSTISSPEEYMEIGWDGLKNFAALDGKADPRQYATDNLFGSGQGVANHYNLWDKPGNELIDPATGKFRDGVNRKYTPEDWEDYAFSPSMRQEHNIRISGGSENTSFFASFGYLNDKGYSIKSDYDRLSTRLNLDHKVNDWIKASVNLGYAFSDRNVNGQSEDSGSIFWFVDNMPSIYPLFLRDASGNMIADPYFKGNYVYDYGDNSIGNKRRFGALTNAISDASYNLMNGKRHDVNVSANMDFDLFKNITLTLRAGSQFQSDLYNSLGNPFYGGAVSNGGSVYKVRRDQINFNMLEMLKYSNTFGENHNFNVLVAHENYSSTLNYGNNFNTGLIINDLPELSNTTTRVSSESFKEEYTLESYFGQIEYNFAKKYYVTGTARRDGSSRFLNDKWGTFWSVGAGWVLTREDFLADNKAFDYLKLKSSYGVTGEQAWGDPDSPGLANYTGYNLYNIGKNGIYDFRFDFPGSPNLTWEESTMFQVGAELGILNRVDVNLDYYRKNTNNLLFERRVAPSVGYAIQKANDGELLNSGLEFDVQIDVIKKDDYFFNVGFNGEIIHNELLSMPIEPGTGKEKVIDVGGIYGRSVGHSVYDFYTREWAGVDAQTGAAMWNQYFDDANGNGALDADEKSISSMAEYLAANPNANVASITTTRYSDATQKYVGKTAIPDVRGAVNLSAGIKNFEMSVQLLYSIGGYSYDGAYAGLMDNGKIGANNWHTDIRDRWQQPGDVTDIPRLSNDFSDDSNFASTSTRFLTKSDYLALNNIRIGYNFPTNYIDQIGLEEMSLYVQGDNLWLLSEREGFNPSTDIAGASDTYRYSPLSTFTFGVRVKL